MSGVLDKYGQWERCNGCGEYVLIDHLGYEQPKAGHPHGRDLCIKCVVKGVEAETIDINHIVPSVHWTPVYAEDEEEVTTH